MLTKHAEARCQQRGIRDEVVEALLSYGQRQYRHGAEVCYMDRAARADLKRAIGRKAYARLADRLNTYVVLSTDGAVVTAARRHGRLKF